MRMLETNKALARQYLDLIGKCDGEAVADMFVGDGAIIVESHTLLPPEIRGRENIKNIISGLREIFPETGLPIIVDDVTAEDNRVAVRAHSEAIHVSGKRYANRYHFLLRFADGKITTSHEYLDSLLLTEVFFDGAKPD